MTEVGQGDLPSWSWDPQTPGCWLLGPGLGLDFGNQQLSWPLACRWQMGAFPAPITKHFLCLYAASPWALLWGSLSDSHQHLALVSCTAIHTEQLLSPRQMWDWGHHPHLLELREQGQLTVQQGHQVGRRGHKTQLGEVGASRKAS